MMSHLAPRGTRLADTADRRFPAVSILATAIESVSRQQSRRDSNHGRSCRFVHRSGGRYQHQGGPKGLQSGCGEASPFLRLLSGVRSAIISRFVAIMPISDTGSSPTRPTTKVLSKNGLGANSGGDTGRDIGRDDLAQLRTSSFFAPHRKRDAHHLDATSKDIA